MDTATLYFAARSPSNWSWPSFLEYYKSEDSAIQWTTHLDLIIEHDDTEPAIREIARELKSKGMVRALLITQGFFFFFIWIDIDLHFGSKAVKPSLKQVEL